MADRLADLPARAGGTPSGGAIADAFDQTEARDPAHRRDWAVLVDGARHPLDLLHNEAARRGIDVHVLLDLVHVTEYATTGPGTPTTTGRGALHKQGGGGEPPKRPLGVDRNPDYATDLDVRSTCGQGSSRYSLMK